MTLNGGKVTLAEKNYAAHQKNLNEGRFILPAAKCRPMILASRNIRFVRIFAGVPRGGAVKRQWGCGHRPKICLTYFACLYNNVAS